MTDLKSAAKAGDIQALQEFMSQNLEARDISVKLAKYGHTLEVQLQSDSLPERQISQMIKKWLDDIKPAGIERVFLQVQASNPVDFWVEQWAIEQAQVDRIQQDNTLDAAPQFMEAFQGYGTVSRKQLLSAIGILTAVWFCSWFFFFGGIHQVRGRFTQSAKEQIEEQKTETDSFSDAVKSATNAANLTQTAQTINEWKDIVTMWNEAAALMEEVPDSSLNKEIAVTKQQEYLANAKYAQERMQIAPTAKAPAGCTVEIEPSPGLSNEPLYEGLVGYVTVNRLRRFGNEEEILEQNWKVPVQIQVGPNLYELGNETIPHKTKVRVIRQDLKHESHDYYSGALLVQDISNPIRRVLINHLNFSPVDYWNCQPSQALRYGPFIAEITDNAKPVDGNGRWVRLGTKRKAICYGNSYINSGSGADNSIECLLYGESADGLSGSTYYFDERDLIITY